MFLSRTRPGAHYSTSLHTLLHCRHWSGLRICLWSHESIPLCKSSVLWSLVPDRDASPATSTPRRCFRWARCRPPPPRSRSSRIRRTRPGPWVRCRCHGRGLCLPPSRRSKLRRRQTRSDLHSCLTAAQITHRTESRALLVCYLAKDKTSVSLASPSPDIKTGWRYPRCRTCGGFFFWSWFGDFWACPWSSGAHFTLYANLISLQCLLLLLLLLLFLLPRLPFLLLGFAGIDLQNFLECLCCYNILIRLMPVN